MREHIDETDLGEALDTVLWCTPSLLWSVLLVVCHDPELSCNLIQRLAGCWRQLHSPGGGEHGGIDTQGSLHMAAHVSASWETLDLYMFQRGLAITGLVIAVAYLGIGICKLQACSKPLALLLRRCDKTIILGVLGVFVYQMHVREVAMSIRKGIRSSRSLTACCDQGVTFPADTGSFQYLEESMTS